MRGAEASDLHTILLIR